MELDQLKDFNEVIEYYREILEITSELRPTVESIENQLTNIMKRRKFFSFDDLTMYRVLCNNIALFITQMHEKSKDMDDDALLEIAFANIESLNTIESKKVELSIKEKKEQIRNCLAHADYTFIVNNIELKKMSRFDEKEVEVTSCSICLKIENEYIKGTITIRDMKKFAREYFYAYRYFKYGNQYSELVLSNRDEIENFEDLINTFRRLIINIREDNEGMTFDEVVERVCRELQFNDEENISMKKYLEEIVYGGTSFEYSLEYIKPEEIEFLRRYIDYVGLERFMYNTTSQIAYEQLDVPILTLDDMVRTLQDLKVMCRKRLFDSNYFLLDDAHDVARTINYELAQSSFKAPMIYANNLLGMSYYILNYTREINEQNERRFFNYYNIGNLEEISARLVDNNGNEEEVPIQINPVSKLQKELENVNTDLTNLRRRMKIKRSKLRKMENPNDRTPNKEAAIISIKEELSNDKKKEAEYVSQKDRLQCDIEECQEKDYKDSSDFFRHLRNSLAHGNYTITYGDLSNLEEITYCFRDIDERTLKTYTVELTARQLLMILDAVQLKVNECDRGYLDGKAFEREILEVALRQCEVGMYEVNDEQLIEEEPMQEKGDEEIDES